MGDYFDDWNNGEVDEFGDNEFDSADPLDSLGKREQDIFFRVLDLIPDDKRELAMEYFFDHPKKITGLIDYVKQHKAQLTKKDPTLAGSALGSQGIRLEDLDPATKSADSITDAFDTSADESPTNY